MHLRDLGALFDTSNPPPECVLTEPLEPHLPNLTDYSSVVQALWFDSGAADNPTARSYVFYFFKGAIDEQRRPDKILTFKVRLDNPFKVHIVDQYLGGMAFGAINAPALAHRNLWRPGLMSHDGKQEFSAPSTSSTKKTESEKKESGSVAGSEMFLDVVKESSSVMTGVWDKYGELITSRIVQAADKIAKSGMRQIANDEKYKKYIVDPLWYTLPLPVRLLGRKRLRLDALLFGSRDKLFLIQGEDVRVHPNAKEQVAIVIKSVLGHHTLSDAPYNPEVQLSYNGPLSSKEDDISKKVECARCKGKGTMRDWTILGLSKEKKCPVCGGQGYVYEKK